MPINAINHITLRVSDLDRSEQFYAGLLGLRRVGQRPSMRFYTTGRFAHELALVQDPHFRLPENNGLMHLCFNVSSEQGLRDLYRRCRSSGYATSAGVDHRVMHAFYLRDPDGYVIELGNDRPAKELAGDPHAFADDGPLDLSADG